MKRYESGQTLLEIILALSVVVVVITGITFAITTSLKNATFTKNQNLASSFAQQGMDIAKGIKDRNWTYFNSNYNNPPSKSYFLPESSANIDIASEAKDSCPPPGPACTPNVGGIFTRWVKIERSHNDCDSGGSLPSQTKVTVRVSWSDKICNILRPYCHYVELVSCFANTNIVPTP